MCVCWGVTGWQIDVVAAQYRCDQYRTAGGLFPSHWPCRLRVRRNRVESRDEAVLSYMYSCHLLLNPFSEELLSESVPKPSSADVFSLLDDRYESHKGHCVTAVQHMKKVRGGGGTDLKVCIENV